MSLQNTQTVLPVPEPEYRYATKPDKPDPRDVIKVYGAPDIPSTEDHPVVDLRKYVTQVYTQGLLGSCAACTVCAAYKLERARQSIEKGYAHYQAEDVSRLFLYYNSREYDNSTGVDDGASLRDTLKAINSKGVCKESFFPYDIKNFAQKPTQASYDDAEGNIIKKYALLRQDIDQFRACLKAGYPVAFCFRIYKDFSMITRRDKGMMPTPSDNELNTTRPGGHGSLLVGYNDNTQLFTVLNSWGEGFGDHGYFYMPYKFIMNPKSAFNFWKIEEVSQKFKIEIQVLPRSNMST